EARLVFSGGNGLPLTQVPGEAELARRAYREVGLEGPRMVFENNSRNTRESAVLSQKLAKPQRRENWLLVTSAAHMPRAVGSFRAVGWQVIPYPVDYTTGGVIDPIVDFSGVRQFSRLGQALREGLGLAYYYWQGWTEELFPAPQ
ncbi:MAG: YdcF family protein, partial [Hyphomicrobiales bacterium]